MNARENEVAYRFKLAVAKLRLGDLLAQSERDAARRAKMERVVELNRALLVEVEGFKALLPAASPSAYDLWMQLGGQWKRLDALRLLIELMFMHPFAPFELRCEEKSRIEVLVRLARFLHLSENDVSRLRTTISDAFKALASNAFSIRGSRLWAGVAVAIITAPIAWWSAPAIGALIGSWAGLSGAAATSYGLAMLGGGSLAAGGFGMAGGAWLVTAAGAAVGAAAGGATGGGFSSAGSAREIQLVLHPQALRIELAKLLVSYKEIMVPFEIPQATSISGLLDLRRNELESCLEEQALVNDEDSERIKSLKEKIDMLQRSVTWVKKQKNPSAQGA